ncbi:hypothetical protein ANCCAN_20404 [Ancylostoma caninum]|uniref:Uncharacterized protein n=1 Tax=Ancylostoma caninum TaxID=29170 RepID=A0A368FSG6_ANCCA|nr:hypothetical protein ANCCAN_20404 [Ancylostoma caninum]
MLSRQQRYCPAWIRKSQRLRYLQSQGITKILTRNLWSSKHRHQRNQLL